MVISTLVVLVVKYEQTLLNIPSICQMILKMMCYSDGKTLLEAFHNQSNSDHIYVSSIIEIVLRGQIRKIGGLKDVTRINITRSYQLLWYFDAKYH